MNENKPVNSSRFTVDVLEKLSEKGLLSECEKQALKDAVIYLKWMQG